MMESLVENFKTGKMIRSNAYFFSDQKNYHREKENNPRHLSSAAGIGVVLGKEAPRGGELLKQMDRIKLKKEPRFNCSIWAPPNLSLEWQLEKVFKMNTGNLKKFLFLDIVTGDEMSDSNRVPQAWYCIDLSKMLCEGDSWVVGKMDPNVRKMPQNSPSPSMCVALGSVIYLFSGNNYHEPSNIRMYYLDTSNPENRWLEGPSMNVGGDVASAAVHEGKIYVFGCFVEYPEDKHLYGEVYDPVLNCWEPLSDPPVKLDELQGKFVGSYDGRKILVHPCRQEMLCAYDVVDKSWKIIDDDFGSWCYRGVIMDDVLYVFKQLEVEIGRYDLVQSKWLKPINLDQWFPRTEYSEGAVFHQAFFFKVEANVLCLVYFDPMGTDGLDIYCKMFTIKKIMQEDGDVGFEAEVFSSTIYKVGKIGRCINYVVM